MLAYFEHISCNFQNRQFSKNINFQIHNRKLHDAEMKEEKNIYKCNHDQA